MILKNDIIEFEVSHRINGDIENKKFVSYQDAENFAKTLVFAFVNIKATSPDRSSSFSAAVSKVRSGIVEMIHSRYVI